MKGQPRRTIQPKVGSIKPRSLSRLRREKAFTTVLALCGAVAGVAALPAAQAEVTTKERVIDQPLLVVSECGQAEVEILSGTIDLHILATSTINGNHVSDTYHLQTQGGLLIDAQTEDVYRPVSVTNETIAESPQSALHTLTFANSFRIIGRGPDNDNMVHLVTHLTMTPNGEMVAEVEKLTTVQCR